MKAFLIVSYSVQGMRVGLRGDGQSFCDAMPTELTARMRGFETVGGGLGKGQRHLAVSTE